MYRRGGRKVDHPGRDLICRGRRRSAEDRWETYSFSTDPQPRGWRGTGSGGRIGGFGRGVWAPLLLAAGQPVAEGNARSSDDWRHGVRPPGGRTQPIPLPRAGDCAIRHGPQSVFRDSGPDWKPEHEGDSFPASRRIIGIVARCVVIRNSDRHRDLSGAAKTVKDLFDTSERLLDTYLETGQLPWVEAQRKDTVDAIVCALVARMHCVCPNQLVAPPGGDGTEDWIWLPRGVGPSRRKR